MPSGASPRWVVAMMVMKIKIGSGKTAAFLITSKAAAFSNLASEVTYSDKLSCSLYTRISTPKTYWQLGAIRLTKSDAYIVSSISSDHTLTVVLHPREVQHR